MGRTKARGKSRAIAASVAAVAIVLGIASIGIAVPPHQPVAAASGFASFAVKSDGTLWAWGANQFGQLGVGDKTPRDIPVQVGSDADWKSLACETYRTYGIKDDGTLWAWGQEYIPPFSTESSVPVQVLADQRFRMIDTAVNHTIAVRSDGTLWGWGYNGHGALGAEPGTAPVQIGTESDWTTVSCGYDHTLALKADGSLWAWGTNDRGQLGLGDTAAHAAPARVGSGTWVAVSAGSTYSSAIKSDGSVWVWGDDTLGQLGDGVPDEVAVSSPRRVGTENTWVEVSSNALHTVARKADGSMWAWGFGNGALGVTTPGAMALKPRRVGAGKVWGAIAAGEQHTVGVTTGDEFGACGQNDYGQTGLGYPNYRHTPEQVGIATGWASVDAGLAHVVAIRGDGSLYTWGRNAFGESGILNSAGNLPERVGYDTDWAKASAGDDMNGGFTVALKADGSLWSWGSNGTGQLGLGHTDDTYDVTRVGTASDWDFVAASDGVGGTGRTINNDDWVPRGFAMAIKDDGSLWAWGDNSHGQLGIGNRSTKLAPVRVGADTWKTVALGDEFAVGIKNDGSLWGWGSDWNDQLEETSAKTDILTPQPMPGSVGKTWKQIACTSGRDSANVIALTESGEMYGWGVDGSLLGIYEDIGHWQTVGPQPGRMGTASDWAEIAAGSGFGDNFLIARKVDGSLYSSGTNFRGVLGHGDYVGPSALSRVGAAADWSQLGVGTNVFAIKADGSLWAWGDNSWGALGLGDPEYIATTSTFRIISEEDTVAPSIDTSEPVASTASVSSAGVVDMAAGERWYRTNVTVSLNARDAGMGVSRTQYSVNNGISWKTARSVTISRNGTTTIRYRAIDRVGNKSGIGSRVVRVDKVRPVPYAYSSLAVRRGSYTTFKYQVRDICPDAHVYLWIYNSAGRRVRSYSLYYQDTNVWKTRRVLTGLPRGTYKWRVYARDLAGNTQAKYAWKYLYVR